MSHKEKQLTVLDNLKMSFLRKVKKMLGSFSKKIYGFLHANFTASGYFLPSSF